MLERIGGGGEDCKLEKRGGGRRKERKNIEEVRKKGGSLRKEKVYEKYTGLQERELETYKAAL